jgi:hypothetical protein
MYNHLILNHILSDRQEKNVRRCTMGVHNRTDNRQKTDIKFLKNPVFLYSR